ncbi:prolyl oligopeptidase family serine peptidase [Silvibacterium sp.]|uniref:dipeptidyl-peptidase 5 n=1 Tax=Silvibacterium sp. TaxID=1964179 RepID=UPI0039E56B31
MIGKHWRTALTRVLGLGVLSLGLFAGGAWAQTAAKRPMTFEDMMKMRRLGDVAVSPDGRWVMYSATDVSLAQNTKTSHLWIVPVTGGEPHALLAWEAGENRGRFSPDGRRILFQSTREGGQQVWLADFDAETGKIGEPHKLTSLSTEADGAMWSPDSQSILFVSAVYPECNDDGCNQKKDEAKADSKVKAQVFTHLLYRHWDHFTDDKRSHLFLISADGGTPRDLTPGDDHDVPPFSMGGPDPYAFAPDGKEIAFEENLDTVQATSTNVDIFTLRLDDAHAKPVKISTAAGGDHSPAYSPDGKWIAWRSQARAGYESDRFRLVVYDRASKKIAEPLPDFDRWVDEFVWAPDSQKIYFAAGDTGEEPIFVTSLDGKQSSELTDEGTYGDLHVTPDEKTIVASRQTVREPGDVVALETDRVRKTAAAQSVHRTVTYVSPTGLGVAQTFLAQKDITHLNAALLEELDLPKLEHYWFSSLGRVRVEGFILRPPGFDETKKYPVKVLIHGGPQGEWGDSWSFRWNAELLAANGYVVVMINPGGSVGYGQAFVDRVNRDWGGRPYVDLMNGMDAAEVKYPFIDKGRECALGASYGGFMADWILGHTDRFRCIVTHDGMFNPESAYGTTEELWFNEWEFGGTPWANRALYRRWSPMLSAPKMKTPTLVIHSQLDYRLDVSEGYQLFTTLQRMGVPSKMLYFPDESHWVAKPQNSELWYKTVNDWVDQWTK